MKPLLACGLILAAALPLALGAPPQAPAPNATLRFDAASIKPMEPPITSMSVRLQAGTSLHVWASVSMILQAAYDLQPNQIQGLTQSANRLFDIRAETPEPATVEQQRAMLRNLLADRFKLAVRIEDRVVPGFELEVDKGGLRNLPSGNTSQKGISNISMAQFADILKPNADGYSCDCGGDYLPVVDKTGLSGTFNPVVALGHAFLSPTNPPGDNYYHPDGMPPVTIDELLHEKLGLRLVRAKVSETILTVVHIEKPTPD